MSYLDCVQYDCCHNKAGCCCLGGIKVCRCEGGDAVCGSYRCNESCGNVATDNLPATSETEVHCNDAGCRFLAGHNCRAEHVNIDESGCGPRCVSRAPKTR